MLALRTYRIMNPNEKRAEEIRQKVKMWLIPQGYNVSSSLPSPDELWGMNCTVESTGFGFHSGILRSMPHLIVFSLTLPLELYERALGELESKDRKEFLYDLRIKLLDFDIAYSVPLNPFSELVFQTHLLSDNLTRRELLSATNQLSKAVNLTVFMLGKKFDLDGGDSLLFPTGTIH